MNTPKAANDNYIRDSRKPIACPTLVRLGRNNIPAAAAVCEWRDMTKPGDPFEQWTLPPGVKQHIADGFNQVERKMHKLFSRRELEYLAAAANDNNGRPTFDEHGFAHLGGLTFWKGKCVTKGVFSDDDEFRETREANQGGGNFGYCDGEQFSSALEAETHRKGVEVKLRTMLGVHARVLDMAITDATAEDIGRSLGFEGKLAERMGIEATNEAIAEFRRCWEALSNNAELAKAA